MHPESVKILNVRKARVKGTDMKAKKDLFNTTKIHKCTLKVHSKYTRPNTKMWKDYSGVRKRRRSDLVLVLHIRH